MRSVRFDPATHTSIDAVVWSRWEARARESTEEMRGWFDARAKTSPNTPLPAQPKFNAAVWSDLKDIILEKVFRGRCAFCEVAEDVNAFGDAEHYRPKRPVEAVNVQGKMKPLAIGAEDHPGYGWLAYDWQNLVVACSKCNTFKANQFPVGAMHCTAPTAQCETTVEINTFEQPLLLHPYFDVAEEHLTFGVRGIVSARGNSIRGRATIEVCRLDREALRAARDREQINAWRAVEALVRGDCKLPDAVQEFEKRCLAGEEKFSAAVLDYVYAKLAEHLELLKADQKSVERVLAARRI